MQINRRIAVSLSVLIVGMATSLSAKAATECYAVSDTGNRFFSYTSDTDV